MSTDTQQDAREQARHNASVMIAFAEGKEIQYRLRSDENDSWDPCSRPYWDFKIYLYRVKPEERKPIKLTVEYNGDGQPIVHGWDQPLPIGLTHFIEVLPETETE